MVCMLAVALVACAPRGVARIGGGASADVTRAVREGRGDEAAYTRAAAAEYARTPRAWLWRVGGCGAASPSYLLGTMHLGVRFSDALPSPLDEALYGARAIAFEIDLREPDVVPDADAPVDVAPLDERLPPATWALLRAELDGIVPEGVLRSWSPGRVASYLHDVRMAEAEAEAEGREPVRGVATSARLDQSIFTWAVSMLRPIVALETLRERHEAMDGVYPAGADITALFDLVEDPAGSRRAADRARRAYVDLDVVAVEAHLLGSFSPAEREGVLVRRNRIWLPRLLAEVRAGSAFVVVGLAHLLGEGSVLGLLLGEGCSVERVVGDGGFVADERPPVVLD